MDHCLLLNADYSPLQVVDWQKAVHLMLDQKVYMVAEYSDRVVRSPSTELPWPAVVALRRFRRQADRVRFNRVHVIARDSFTCQYCGVVPRRPSGRLAMDELTLDHVVPRAQAVNGLVRLPWSGRRVPVTCWENVVTACAPCNRRKGALTPEQADMTLRTIPNRPSSRELLRANFARARIPQEWQAFLPPDLTRWGEG